MKQMVLHEKHLQLKGKFSDFQGWQVPQVYTDVQDEYHAVRTTAGLFDISFLGRIEISGTDAAALLERTFTRNVSRMPERSAHYGLICNEDGFILDDDVLLVLPETRAMPRFLLTTNAVNTEKILAWLRRHASADVRIADWTRDIAHFSLQGPQSPYILEKVLAQHAKKFKPRAVKEIRMGDLLLMIARAGYTGEHGYELFIPADRAGELWDRVMQEGREFGIMACGMASRDILRLEMGYRLYGSDIDESRNPIEAGLDRFVDFKKAFIGRDRLDAIRSAGTSQRLAGFILLEKNIPRYGGSIFSENREIGTVTSGVLSPALRMGIGLGYVVTRYAQPGQEIEIEIRDREYAARIADLPFYKKK
jgi:aminomethyltransferase